MHVARGDVTVNGRPLEAGDAAKLTGRAASRARPTARQAEVLVFDLPG